MRRSSRHGPQAAVGRRPSGASRVRTNFHFIIGRRTVARKLIAFAVMMALVLGMTGCRMFNIG